jgi:hypothetical protein
VTAFIARDTVNFALADGREWRQRERIACLYNEYGIASMAIARRRQLLAHISADQ